ncbi:MAG: UDP-2,3-diacylglucosamine diphosphatase LpxI, partial [Pseudomonadota bacterium]
LSPNAARGGVLVKATKPNQDLRADLPTIGPRTIEAAAALELQAVAVEAGRSVVTQLAATKTKAEAAGICLIGLDRPWRPEPSCNQLAMEDRDFERRILSASPKREAWMKELTLAVRVLSRITELRASAAVCTSRQRVLSIALGDEAKEIVSNISQIRQWNDRAGKHRQAAIAFSTIDLMTPSLLSAAAARGVRSVAFLEPANAQQVATLADVCNRESLELVDLS